MARRVVFVRSLENIRTPDGSEMAERERGRRQGQTQTGGGAEGRKPAAWLRVDFTRTTYNLYA